MILLNIDFDLSTVNGEQNTASTRLFASASFFANQSRFAKDDLESLVYSLWFLAGVPMDRMENPKSFFPPFVPKPQGQTFFENRKKGMKYARSQLMVSILSFGSFDFILMNLI